MFYIKVDIKLIQEFMINEQEISKNFQATTVTNRFNPSLPPSLDSTYKHP